VDAVIGAWGRPSARPQLVVPVRTAVDGELAAARADVARLSVATFEEAHAARAAIRQAAADWGRDPDEVQVLVDVQAVISADRPSARDRKSTRLNSSHVSTSYAVFCLKKTSRPVRSRPPSPAPTAQPT